MGLYLAVFDGEEELEGVDVGSYADFGRFREAVTAHLEGGVPGLHFPTLILHSDCDGSWSLEEAPRLASELGQIAEAFSTLPPIEHAMGTWQSEVLGQMALRPTSLHESFFDVDGEPLIERLIGLAHVSIDHHRPILFQ